jgi:hypothetical protein
MGICCDSVDFQEVEHEDLKNQGKGQIYPCARRAARRFPFIGQTNPLSRPHGPGFMSAFSKRPATRGLENFRPESLLFWVEMLLHLCSPRAASWLLVALFENTRGF